MPSSTTATSWNIMFQARSELDDVAAAGEAATGSIALADKIITRFENCGLELVALNMFQPTEEHAQNH